jgi:hypothetical protein
MSMQVKFSIVDCHQPKGWTCGKILVLGRLQTRTAEQFKIWKKNTEWMGVKPCQKYVWFHQFSDKGWIRWMQKTQFQSSKNEKLWAVEFIYTELGHFFQKKSMSWLVVHNKYDVQEFITYHRDAWPEDFTCDTGKMHVYTVPCSKITSSEKVAGLPHTVLGRRII